MNKDQILTLLSEHQALMLKLRKVCSYILDIVESNFSYLDIELISNHRSKRGKQRNHVVKSEDEMVKRKTSSILNVFLKISSLVLKLIPLEQQIYGTKIAKNINYEEITPFVNKRDDDCPITERDIDILERFLESYKNRNIEKLRKGENSV